jgi:hypothetical protein
MDIFRSALALRATLLTALFACAHITTATAQSLPSPWSSSDIGSPALSGSTVHNSGVFTTDAGGSGLGGGTWAGPTDQIHFVSQRVTGDVDIIVRVDALTSHGVWTEAGVMIRSSLAANSAHATAEVTAGRGVQFARRLGDGGATVYTAGPAGTAPAWLRATRVGTRVTAYSSSNGTTWTTLGSDTIALGSTSYVGLAVSSHNPSYRTNARISNVRVTGAALPPAGLPSAQRATDIGSPSTAGSTAYSNGTYTIRAAGADIWDVADQFHFVYQPMTGNGEIIVRVASITRADNWSKAGVMVRESLTAASRHASVFASAGKGYAFQRRVDTGEYSVHTAGGSGTPPGWVRLVRTGDLFEAYRSANGSSWTRIGSDTIAMGETVYVGLAVTSHNTTSATTAVLDGLRITAVTSPTNRPPAVSVTAPANGATVTAPTTVTITASASDPENRLLSVDFYAGSTLISRDTTSPYSAAWSATSAGAHSLTAVAHDADGGSTTSAAITVNVSTPPSTTPPRAVSFTASADHATNVTRYMLSIYAAGANPATATPVATSDLGKPTPAAGNTITVDRAAFFSALAAGNYLATVTAVGPGGQTRSSSVTFAR